MVNRSPRCPISVKPDIMLPLAPPGPDRGRGGGRDTHGTGVVMQTVLDGR